MTYSKYWGQNFVRNTGSAAIHPKCVSRVTCGGIATERRHSKMNVNPRGHRGEIVVAERLALGEIGEEHAAAPNEGALNDDVRSVSTV